ncbi:MAG TPA: SMI1/KNR4 family protein [Longimicrobium sp.]|nr:SMI1/KNR4 family protein [Longimicrobium sp.]
MGVIESASRLFQLLATNDDTFTRHLRSGMPEARIREIMAPTGVELPAEAIAFYSRFNFANGYQYTGDQPTFYGIYWLLSLEDAVEQYTLRAQHRFYYDDDDEVPAEVRGWFPLLQEDGNYYMLDTAHPCGGPCAVVDVSTHCDSVVAFVSMQAMFDTLYHWVQEGIVPVEKGHVGGAYDGDPLRVAQIAARFNPGVGSWAS